MKKVWYITVLFAFLATNARYLPLTEAGEDKEVVTLNPVSEEAERFLSISDMYALTEEESVDLTQFSGENLLSVLPVNTLDRPKEPQMLTPAEEFFFLPFETIEDEEVPAEEPETKEKEEEAEEETPVVLEEEEEELSGTEVISENEAASVSADQVPEKSYPKTDLGGAEDIELLYRLVESEAGQESSLGRRLVADCVLNMARTQRLTIKQAILNPGIFDVVSSGVIYKTVPSESTIQCVNTELEGQIDYGVMYFRNKHFHTFGVPYEQVGNHYFSKAVEDTEEQWHE